MLDYLINAIGYYVVAYQSGALHLDNRAMNLYATGWLVNWLDERR